MGTFSALDYLGPFWDHLRPFWTILCFGMILAPFWTNYNVLGPFLGRFCDHAPACLSGGACHADRVKRKRARIRAEDCYGGRSWRLVADRFTFGRLLWYLQLSVCSVGCRRNLQSRLSVCRVVLQCIILVVRWGHGLVKCWC